MNHLRRSRRNWFTGGDVDRLAHRRLDADWLQSQLHADNTRWIVSWRSSSLFRAHSPLSPLWVGPQQQPTLPSEAESVVLLGEIRGVIYFGLGLPAEQETYRTRFRDAGQFHDLQNVGVELPGPQASLLAYARGIAYWHRRHLFCGTCGQPTRSLEAGHLRVCTDSACGARHFPRTDPAVIVLIRHRDRCLLARQRGWPAHLYSVVAGFVEPGESLEETVHREVAEETGLDVTDIEYRSSQPWPFPSSLMLGFRARALTSEIDLRDEELEHAAWFSRDELIDAVQRGELRVPSAISISYRLVEEWFDAGDAGRLLDLANAVEAT